VIENMARQADTVFLQVFSPPGPERVYRDPRLPEARADFEVIRDPRVKAPPGAKPVAVARDAASTFAVAGGRGKAHVLLDEKVTGSSALALSVVEFPPGLELPRHDHPGSSELLYVLSGGGKVTVGSEALPFGAETAVALPAGQPHAARIGGAATMAIQIYAPAGPEQRYREEAAGAKPSK
jgi:quercetin dioxygenase-like cupin family protein